MSLAAHEVAQALAMGWAALASGEGLVATSLGLDVLEVDPDHQEALRLVVEASGRQERSLVVTDERAEAMIARIDDPHVQAALEGKLAYRRALAMLDERVPGFVVRGWFERALVAFERASTAGDLESRGRARAVARILAHNPSLRSQD